MTKLYPIFRIVLYNVDEVRKAERGKEQLLLPAIHYWHVAIIIDVLKSNV